MKIALHDPSEWLNGHDRLRMPQRYMHYFIIQGQTTKFELQCEFHLLNHNLLY